jgi:hypothetical protein
VKSSVILFAIGSETEGLRKKANAVKKNGTEEGKRDNEFLKGIFKVK